MVISSFIMSIISIVFGLLSFVFIGAVSISLLNNNITTSSHESVDSSDEKFNEGFSAAHDSIIEILQLSLFDMYRNYDILDFDEHYNSIIERMRKISSDSKYRDDIHEEFILHIKGETNDNMDDN